MHSSRLSTILLGAAVAAAVLFASSRIESVVAQPRSTSTPTTAPFRKIETPELHNAHVVTDKVLSGAEPEGEEAFRQLRALGVKTIISVDGAKPDVDTARKYGLRYVHMPITYSTVTEVQGKAIAKAIDELPGPVYIHCHHGKHRSAAAVAVACVYNGMLKPDQAESVLKTFGTGANYTGLWKAAREAKPVDPQALKDLKVAFPETSPVGELADAMVQIDRHTDHLKAVQKAGWVSPKDHPDLDPAHEALQLQEQLRELARTDATRGRPGNFRTILAQNERDVESLRALLTVKPMDKPAADAAFTRVIKSCTECHKGYRD